MSNLAHLETDEPNRSLIPGRLIRVSGEAARIGAPGAGGSACQPRVEMIREGGILKAVEVICGCGQHIRLHCVYAD